MVENTEKTEGKKSSKLGRKPLKPGEKRTRQYTIPANDEEFAILSTLRRDEARAILIKAARSHK